jgi:hypothetical protein
MRSHTLKVTKSIFLKRRKQVIHLLDALSGDLWTFPGKSARAAIYFRRRNAAAMSSVIILRLLFSMKKLGPACR